jgi:hypothetical protein
LDIEANTALLHYQLATNMHGSAMGDTLHFAAEDTMSGTIPGTAKPSLHIEEVRGYTSTEEGCLADLHRPIAAMHAIRREHWHGSVLACKMGEGLLQKPLNSWRSTSWSS